MEYEEDYNDLAERASIIEDYESRKLRMLHDTFYSDWTGEAPHGTMIFTDVPDVPVIADPSPLEVRVTNLESEVKALKDLKVIA